MNSLPSSTSGWSANNPLSKYNALGAADSTYGAGETLAMQQAVNSGYSFASLSGVGVYRDAAGADQGGDQLISMPGYLSSLDTNADGTPHLTDGHETVNLTPMQVSASPEDLSSAGLSGGFMPTTASWLQPSWAQQGQGPGAAMQSLQVARMDTVPNSNRDNDLLRGIVQIGTTSSNPDDQVAAMAAQHELDQREIAAYGGKLPTMVDHTAFNTEQAILRANSDMAATNSFGAVGQGVAYLTGHDDPRSMYVAGTIAGAGGDILLAGGAIVGTTQLRAGNAEAQSADYGDIPAEHQWRYDRYLDGPSASKLGPDEWYAVAQRAWANNASGNGFEQEVRSELGAPIWPGSKPISINGYIPDLPVGGTYGVTDVKNWIDVTNNDQLRAFHQYALDNGLPFNLIIGPRTQTMSSPLLNNIRETGGSVMQYDPATRQFISIDIGQSGSWRRN